MPSLLDHLSHTDSRKLRSDLAPGALLLGGFALPEAHGLLAQLPPLVAQSPFRHMVTKGGHRMSVAMTNCGALGWVSDRTGYRYVAADPVSGRSWPAMPNIFEDLARRAAEVAGFPGFIPDVCLINRYEPGTGLTLHQDRDERDFSAPIVSVSLGAPAIFLFGGPARGDKQRRISLLHGDVVVWGGPARLNFHGIAPLKPDQSTVLGPQRLNLTFRKAQ
jgi:alkylated DNA repair protein (DNA oxidative demethylase)